MSPQEKAIELYYKFTAYAISHSDNKQCALIAVDEIVKEIKLNSDDFQANVPMSVYTYWSNVKEEIKKL